MEQFLKIVTPFGRTHWVALLAGFLVLIFSFGVLVRGALFGLEGINLYQRWVEAVIVSTPFLLMAFWSLRHMKDLQDRLAQLATTDMLTGLPNRRAFLDELKQQKSSEHGDFVMMLDVDHFKNVNDTYGHEIGDICLRNLSQAIQGVVRENDVVARMGGEEFAVILQNVSEKSALVVGNRIAQGTSVQIELDAHNEHLFDDLNPTLEITVSVGACRRMADDSPNVVLKRADQAMYQAKRAGRAQVIMCSQP